MNLDKLWVGLGAGLVAPAIAFFSYYSINYWGMPYWRFIRYLKMGDTYTSIVTLCILSNLAIFYLFIWRKKYSGARGVLAATFVWAAIIMYLKYFTHNE